ncbi:MAG: hypothetical protein DYH17_16480, partial [Xanthomonadales bacterium PRO6]|nr:hypothetical protein [Xanthomonadales bacterium PRO6]
MCRTIAWTAACPCPRRSGARPCRKAGRACRGAQEHPRAHCRMNVGSCRLTPRCRRRPWCSSRRKLRSVAAGARAERKVEKMRLDPNRGVSLVQTHRDKELSAAVRAAPLAPLVALAAMSVIACADGEAGSRVKRPISIPESVSVSAAQVEVGTAIGTIRKHVQVPSFRMSRYPTTVAQYRECVAARACTPPARTTGACTASDQGPAGRTYSEAGALDDAPVTCAALGQAAKYCEWVGGRLPRVEEWLGASRGPSVRRYAWADQRLECDKHPAAIAVLGTKTCCPAGGCSAEQVVLVGKHPAGSS